MIRSISGVYILTTTSPKQIHEKMLVPITLLLYDSQFGFWGFVCHSQLYVAALKKSPLESELHYAMYFYVCYT